MDDTFYEATYVWRFRLSEITTESQLADNMRGTRPDGKFPYHRQQDACVGLHSRLSKGNLEQRVVDSRGTTESCLTALIANAGYLACVFLLLCFIVSGYYT